MTKNKIILIWPIEIGPVSLMKAVCFELSAVCLKCQSHIQNNQLYVLNCQKR